MERTWRKNLEWFQWDCWYTWQTCKNKIMNYAAITVSGKYLQAKPTYLLVSFLSPNIEMKMCSSFRADCCCDYLCRSLSLYLFVAQHRGWMWQCLPSSSSEGNVRIGRVVALPGQWESSELCVFGAPASPRCQESQMTQSVGQWILSWMTSLPTVSILMHVRITRVFHGLDNLQQIPSSSPVEIVVLDDLCRATAVDGKGPQGVSGKRSVEHTFGFANAEWLFQAFCTSRLALQQSVLPCTLQPHKTFFHSHKASHKKRFKSTFSLIGCDSIPMHGTVFLC